MANHFSHSALPYPIRNARYTLLVPYIDATGTPTDPTTPDTECSKDAGAFADLAEEVSTITGSNGMGYVTLTGAETDCVMLGLAAKIASGPKPTLATLYPRTLPIVSSGTLSAGSAGGGTLQAALGYDIAGCFIRTTGGTGGGGTGGASNQARKLITYTQSTGAFTVSPNWETTVSTDTTYDILLPEGATLAALKALNPATPGRTLVVDANGLADANTVKLGPSGSGAAQTARDVGAAVPAVAPGANGGLPTVNASNQVAGVSGNVSGNVTGSVGSLAAQAKLDVNAEVVDGLGVDTLAEMGAGAPPLAPTMREVLNYMYRWAIRNTKKVDASASPAVETVFADDTTTPLFKRNIADAANVTTFAETVSG